MGKKERHRSTTTKMDDLEADLATYEQAAVRKKHARDPPQQTPGAAPQVAASPAAIRLRKQYPSLTWEQAHAAARKQFSSWSRLGEVVGGDKPKKPPKAKPAKPNPESAGLPHVDTDVLIGHLIQLGHLTAADVEEAMVDQAEAAAAGPGPEGASVETKKHHGGEGEGSQAAAEEEEKEEEEEEDDEENEQEDVEEVERKEKKREEGGVKGPSGKPRWRGKGPGGRTVATATKIEVFERDGYVCRSCGKHFPQPAEGEADKPPKGLSVDHWVPFSAGGPCTTDNLLTMCAKPCNLKKSAMWGKDLNPPMPFASEVPAQPQRCSFGRPHVHQEHLHLLNSRVRYAVQQLEGRNVFVRVAGGVLPRNFLAVRESLEELDPALADSPLKKQRPNNGKRKAEEDEKEGGAEMQPPAKARRTK